jgi:hypothetical protein
MVIERNGENLFPELDAPIDGVTEAAPASAPASAHQA